MQLAAAGAARLTGGQQPYYRKRLALDGEYTLVLMERPTTRPGRRTFALAVDHAGSSSIVLFTSNDGREALDARHERYRMALELRQAGDSWEVARTAFETDIVLPIDTTRRETDEDPPAHNELHLQRGGAVTWPSGTTIRLVPQLRPRLRPA